MEEEEEEVKMEEEEEVKQEEQEEIKKEVKEEPQEDKSCGTSLADLLKKSGF